MTTKICIGEIVGTHGIRGDIKVNTFTEDPRVITEYGTITDEQGREYVLSLRFVKGSVAVCACDGVTNPEDGKALRGTKLYVARENLPELDDEDDFYIEDLVGLTVQNEQGETLGVIHQMHDFGAGDIAEITFDEGKREMFAFSGENFPLIDVEAGVVTFIRPHELKVKQQRK